MFSIGLTGGIGSGKSLVADMLQGLGAVIVDTDAIAHELTGPEGAAMPAIAAAFGRTVIRADGALDRAAMRDLAFSDAHARQKLQDILHPMITHEAQRQAEQANRTNRTNHKNHTSSGTCTVFVVPLLVESGRWRARVQRICVVDCTEDEQRARVRRRSNLTFSQIARIMDTQATRTERLAVADDVIDNRGGVSVDEVRQQVLALHARWQMLAAAAVRAPSEPD